MEEAFLHWLTRRIPTNPCLEIGIGDDAAVVARPADELPNQPSGSSDTNRNDRLVVTTDLLSDGTHFRLGEVAPQRIGRKALAVNLSDLAAMASKPLAAVIAIALPRGSALELATELYEGVIALADEFGIAIAGGDTNTHDGPVVLSVTAFGSVSEAGPLTRSGGRVGDRLIVTGTLGGSILGHQFDFVPRVTEALLLNQQYQLHAGIDLSDGLALDASRLATASGLGAVIDVDRLPISNGAEQLADSGSGLTKFEHALRDGEDFELLLAVPPPIAEELLHEQPVKCGLTDIGELVSSPGLWQRSSSGTQQSLDPIGFLHE